MSNTISMYEVEINNTERKIEMRFENWHMDQTQTDRFSHSFDYDYLMKNQIFTWSQLLAAFQQLVRNQGITLHFPCLPSDQIIDDCKKKLSQLRTSTWKELNVAHTLTVQFNYSDDDIALWKMLEDTRNKQETIKDILKRWYLYGEENQN